MNAFNWHHPPLRVQTLVAFACVCLCLGCAGPPIRPVISINEIVSMAGNGLPAAAIIEKIQASNSVYPLPASKLLELKQKGVPDEVLDYMEQTYLTEACRQAIWDDSGELYTARTIKDCY